jgi:hypothetical protein
MKNSKGKILFHRRDEGRQRIDQDAFERTSSDGLFFNCGISFSSSLT